MKLILVRHGQSMWNLENKFTGWTDVDLSEKGIEEAKEAGKLLKENNIKIDLAYTSYLKRAKHTLDIILKEMNINVPIKESWKLNERHYGALQGLNKDDARKEYGEEQVHLWRRSADVRPPKLDENDKRSAKFDPKYKGIKVPLTENLMDTLKRVKEYYEEEIKENLKTKNIIIVAHGNSLRALRMHIENISKEDIINLNIPTGKPFIYEFDKDLNILDKYYLGDD